MESFFQRMSSIVIHDEEKSKEENQHEEQSRNSDKRRSSSPNVHSTTLVNDRTPIELNSSPTTPVQINANRFVRHSSTMMQRRRERYSTGKFLVSKILFSWIEIVFQRLTFYVSTPR